MSDPQTKEEHRRIQELEAQVRRLTREVETLRRERRSGLKHGRRAGDLAPKPPPTLGRLWVIRSLMLFMTAAIGLAAVTVWRESGFAWDQFRRLDLQTARTQIDYKLLACALAALVATLLHRRRPLAFTLFAMASAYATSALYILDKPDWIVLEPSQYFWIVVPALTAFNILVSILCVMESRRLGRGRKRSAMLAAANALAFYPLIWYSLQRYGAAQAGIVYTGLGATAALLSLYAETSGPHRNYLFQLFTAIALTLVNMAMSAVLGETGFLIAVTLECAALATVFHLTRIIFFKLAGVLLLCLATALCVQAIKFNTPLEIGSHAVRENWLIALFTSSVFLATACFYERVVARVKTVHRRMSGHWFFADTYWDVPSGTVALFHAAAAALIIMILAISDLGGLPSLPYLLASVSAAFAVVGYVARTPQVEIAAVMLAISAHVAFYFFLAIRLPGFETQPFFRTYTLLLALYTYLGAHRGARFLARTDGRSVSELHPSAVLPYLVATAAVVTLVFQTSIPLPPTVSLALLALLLAGSGAATRETGLRVSGAAVYAVAAAYAAYAAAAATAAEQPDQSLLGNLVSLIGPALLIERSFVIQPPDARYAASMARTAQACTLLFAFVAGFVIVTTSARPDQSTAYATLYVLFWVLLAGVASASHYRLNATIGVAVAAGWFVYRQRADIAAAPTYHVVLAILVLCAALGAAWGISLRRMRSAPVHSHQKIVHHG